MKTTTDKQQAVYDFIVAFHSDKGYSPTTREISEHFGFASQTAAVNHVRALVKKRKIRVQEGLARSIVILQSGECDHIVGLYTDSMTGEHELVRASSATESFIDESFLFCPKCGGKLT